MINLRLTYRHYHVLHLIMWGLLLCGALSSCSTKKNTAYSRFYQAFTTRYNVYFNGSEHYKEQKKLVEDDYADDYTQLTLYTHPAQSYASNSAPHPSANFDRTVEKMQKAIQLHSIKKRPKRNSNKMRDPRYRDYLKRDEFNPFIHNAWFMMGKAQFMDGKFTDAAATFHYISRHFTWLPDLALESKIWEARCYVSEGWLMEADNLLMHIKDADLKTKSLKEIYNITMSDYMVRSKRNADAIPYIKVAASMASGGQKARLYFLLGQLYASVDEKALAYNAFKKAGSGSNTTYRTKFNARIKQSEVFTGSDIEKEVKSLRAMTKYDRNKEYLDQIYYAIGNLYLSRADTTKAIENYILAVSKSTRNGMEKAMANLTLGGLYFDQRRFDLAQPCYAEAITLLNSDFPNYNKLKLRSDILDELAVYAQNVQLQDSLLALSKLSEDERMKVAQRLADEYIKKQKEAEEEARREEYLAEQSAKGDAFGNNSNSPKDYTLNTDNSWYFYNTATKNAGKTAFQRQWGNRKLEDDWRRRNKATFSSSDFDEDSDMDTDSISLAEGSDSTSVKQKEAENPAKPEYYLAQIPTTEEEIAVCNSIIQEGLYNMGVILKDKLEDFPAAISQFDRLLRESPDNEYRLDTYYNLYLIYMRMGESLRAEEYRKLILYHFPESNYGLAMRDPDYLEKLRHMEEDQEEMYADAYQNYLDNNNSAVHQAYEDIMDKYPLSKIVPKFMFIDALSYLTDKNYDKFKDVLREMLERYPDTDITPTASSILSQIAKGRKLEGGSSNVRGMIWDMRLSNDSLAALTDSTGLTPFEIAKDTPQYFVIAFDADSTSVNELLFQVARHNFTSFVVRDFDIEPMTFGRLGLIVVKGFANYEELGHYRKVFEADEALKLPPDARIIMISENNFNILLHEGRSLEEYFRFEEEAESDEVEQKALDITYDENDAGAEELQSSEQSEAPSDEDSFR